MIRNLIPWNQLTRAAIPALKVARRPLVFGEVNIPVGQILDPELLPIEVRRQRLRQFYEMRLLEPVEPSPDTQQFYREMSNETPIAPIPPVASRLVADLPTVEVPVAESGALDAKRKLKGGK